MAMDFFSQTYIALRGPTGAPQTALDTICRLSDRLQPSTLLADRRAAVLSLKGLARDCKADVGENALAGLLEVLENDAEIDHDIGKAVLETLNTLCDANTGPESINAPPSPAHTPSDLNAKALGLKHTDVVLATDKAVQKNLVLMGEPNFYVQYAALQFLSTLLQNRRQIVQGYFLKSQIGPVGVLATLESKRDIIRNEGLLLVQSLISHSPDIQKLLAFTGAFEKLFSIIRKEGGIDGGIITQDCLECLDGLLRLNASNQTFFRETGLAGLLTSLLFYPANLQLGEQAPQEFALQFWDPPKTANVGLVLRVLGMLVSTKGGNEAETNSFIRCLIEIALASNAPSVLKTQALQLLPANLSFPLISHIITPYMPVPETNGEEWDRLEPTTALDSLVELVVLGEYAGASTGTTAKEALQLRAAGVSVFENYVRKEEIRTAVLNTMFPHEHPPSPPLSTALLQHLTTAPNSPLDPSQTRSTQFSSLLSSSLLRGSSRSKQLARQIQPTLVLPADVNSTGGSFFVPADGPPVASSSSPAPSPQQEDSDDDAPQLLLPLLTEHLSLCLLSRARAVASDEDSERDVREWDKLIVAYLALLAQWLWEEPGSVREFLESGGMGMLVEPINQTNDMDPVVQGLCAFLLGICYEFNREPGEITRSTIHAIFNRLSVDAIAGRMASVRDDDRFKIIGPEDILVPYRSPAMHQGPDKSGGDIVEVWFDWAFVDFWKSNYYTIQRAITLDPDTLSSPSGDNSEASMLIASLRDVIRKQAAQLEELQRQAATTTTIVQNGNAKLAQAEAQITSLRSQLEALSAELEAVKQKSKEAEKEQEDLLVFLEELSTKRRRDKERLRKLGQDVSEDEGEGEGGDDDEE